MTKTKAKKTIDRHDRVAKAKLILEATKKFNDKDQVIEMLLVSIALGKDPDWVLSELGRPYIKWGFDWLPRNGK